jgi:hypothetical protein
MYSFLLHSPAEACRGARRQLFSMPCAMEKDLPTALYSHRRPRRTFRRKKPLLNGRKGGINTFFRRRTFFFFSCWSCSRRLRGEIGRAEDPFLPNSGRKKLAEAGPPGKRPEEAKAGNCIGMYKKHFINSLKKAFSTRRKLFLLRRKQKFYVLY